MKRKLRLSVTNVFRQTTIQERPAHGFCRICGQEIVLLTIAETAALLATEPENLGELIASGKVHGIETVAGNLRICKNSLSKVLREGVRQ